MNPTEIERETRDADNHRNLSRDDRTTESSYTKDERSDGIRATDASRYGGEEPPQDDPLIPYATPRTAYGLSESWNITELAGTIDPPRDLTNGLENVVLASPRAVKDPAPGSSARVIRS